MNKKKLHYESITALAGGIRKGEFSSTELVEYFLDRIAALDDKLNACDSIEERKILSDETINSINLIVSSNS